MAKIHPKDRQFSIEQNAWGDDIAGACAEVFMENGMWFFSTPNDIYGPYANEFACRNQCMARVLNYKAPIGEPDEEYDYEEDIDWDDELADEPSPEVPANDVGVQWELLNTPVVKAKPKTTKVKSLADILSAHMPKRNHQYLAEG